MHVTPRGLDSSKTFVPGRQRAVHKAVSIGRRSHDTVREEASPQAVVALTMRERKALEDRYLSWGPSRLSTKSDVISFFASLGVVIPEDDMPTVVPLWWKGFLRFDGGVSAPPLLLAEVFDVMEREKRLASTFQGDTEEHLATFVALGGNPDRSGLADVASLVEAARALKSMTSSSSSAHLPPKRFGSLIPGDDSGFNPESLFTADMNEEDHHGGGHTSSETRLPFAHYIELVQYLRSSISGWSDGGRRGGGGYAVSAGSPTDADLAVVLTAARARGSCVSRSVLGGSRTQNESRYFLLEATVLDEASMRLDSHGAPPTHSPSLSNREPSTFLDDDEFDAPEFLAAFGDPMEDSTGDAERLRELQHRIALAMQANASYRAKLMTPLAADERAILRGEPLDPQRYEKAVLDPDGGLAADVRRAKGKFARKPLTKPIEPTLLMRERLRQELLEAEYQLDLTKLKETEALKPSAVRRRPHSAMSTRSNNSSVNSWQSDGRGTHKVTTNHRPLSAQSNPINNFVANVARCAIRKGMMDSVDGSKGPVLVARYARQKAAPTLVPKTALVDRLAAAREKALNLAVRLDATIAKHQREEQQQQQHRSTMNDQSEVELPPKDFVAPTAHQHTSRSLRSPGPLTYLRRAVTPL